MICVLLVMLLLAGSSGLGVNSARAAKADSFPGLSAIRSNQSEDSLELPMPTGAYQSVILDYDGTFDTETSSLADELNIFREDGIADYVEEPLTVLLADGRVLHSDMPLTEWENITGIYAASDGEVIGLTKEGRLISTGSLGAAADWKDVTDVLSLDYGLIGVNKKGKVLSDLFEDWDESADVNRQIAKLGKVQSVQAFGYLPLFHTRNGKLVLAVPEEYQKLLDPDDEEYLYIDRLIELKTEIEKWTKVEKVVCTNDMIVALHKNGLLSYASINQYIDEVDYSDALYVNYQACAGWENIVDVTLLAPFQDEPPLLIALTKDGKLLMDGIDLAYPGLGTCLQSWYDGWHSTGGAGKSDNRSNTPVATGGGSVFLIHEDGGASWARSPYSNVGLRHVNEWINLCSLSASYGHVAGLRWDGTVIASGNDDGRLDVEDWTDIVAIGTGTTITVGLKKDGTVLKAGPSRYGESLCTDWTGVTGIAASERHVIGLKGDGTALSTAAEAGYGCSAVLSWTDLVDVAAGPDYEAAGLKKDGTVVITGGELTKEDGFTKIRDIVFGGDVLYGLRQDGTVTANRDSVRQAISGWSDVTAIAADENMLVGLRSDGSLLIYSEGTQPDMEGLNRSLPSQAMEDFYEDDFFNWSTLSPMPLPKPWQAVAAAGNGFGSGIMGRNRLFTSGSMAVEGELYPWSVVAGGDVMITLNGDGNTVCYGGGDLQQQLDSWSEQGLIMLDTSGSHTVGVVGPDQYQAVATGDNSHGQCDVSQWRNIRLIVAGGRHTVATIGGGRYVVAAGDNSNGQCNVKGWHNITVIAASDSHTLGLARDGRVYATGNNRNGQCKIDAWHGQVTDLAAGDKFSAGLTADGRILLAGKLTAGLKEAQKWENIIAIDAHGETLVGLTADNVLKVTGQADVKDPSVTWEAPEIVHDYMDGNAMNFIAVCEDGSVVYAEATLDYDLSGYDYDEPTYEWYSPLVKKNILTDRTDVAMVAAVNGGALLMEDGTVIAGEQFPEAAQWTNVVQIAGEGDLLAALTADGKVLYCSPGEILWHEIVDNWNMITDIDVADGDIYGLYNESVVLSTNSALDLPTNQWYAMVDIAASGTDDRAGVMAIDVTGRVRHSAGWNEQFDNVLAFEVLDATEGYVLRTDGTIEPSFDDWDQSTKSWKDIVQFATVGRGLIAQDKQGILYTLMSSKALINQIGQLKAPHGVELEVTQTPAPAPQPEPEGQETAGIADFPEASRIVANGDDWVAALLSDGHVLAFGKNPAVGDFGRTLYPETIEGGKAVITEPGWENIVSLYEHNGALFGLREDGTLIAARSVLEHYPEYAQWTDIVHFSDGYGIRKDGTVLLHSALEGEFREFQESWTEVSQWTDVVDIEANMQGIYALRSNGTVVSWFPDEQKNTNTMHIISTWQNIVAIDAGSDELFALTSDGRVLNTERDVTLFFPLDKQFKKLFVNNSYARYSQAWVAIDADSQLSGVVSGNAFRGLWELPSKAVEVYDSGCVLVALTAEGTLHSSSNMLDDHYPASPEQVAAMGLDTVNINTMEGVPGYSEAPAPQPEPEVTEAPAPQPEPVVTETPAPQPEPVVTETPAPQPEPVVTETPAPQPEPVVTEAPAPQPEPVVTEAPAPQPEPTRAASGAVPIPGYDGVAQNQTVQVSASSTVSDSGNFAASKATDGREETSWQFSTKKDPLGSAKLEVALTPGSVVDEMWIKNGFWKITEGKDQYVRNSRPKKIAVSFLYDGASGYTDEIEITLKDDKKRQNWQIVSLGHHEGVSAVRIRVLSIYQGSKFKTDVAISEVMFVEREGAGEVSYQPLSQGDKGPEVLRMKQRLQELSYFKKNAEMSSSYNETCAERVKQFQEANGLPATGEADEITLAVLFSENAKPKP